MSSLVMVVAGGLLHPAILPCHAIQLGFAGGKARVPAKRAISEDGPYNYRFCRVARLAASMCGDLAKRARYIVPLHAEKKKMPPFPVKTTGTPRQIGRGKRHARKGRRYEGKSAGGTPALQRKAKSQSK